MTATSFDTTPSEQDIADARATLLDYDDPRARMGFLAGYLGGTLRRLTDGVHDPDAARSIARARALDLAYDQLHDERMSR